MELREQSKSVLALLLMCSAYLFTSSWINTKIAEEKCPNDNRTNADKDISLNRYEPLVPKSMGEFSANTSEMISSTDVLTDNKKVVSDKHSKKSSQRTQACLQRYICELHAKPPGYSAENKLEESILSNFGTSYMEDPTSPIYPYQLAAHIGQLSSGCQPSACLSLYTNCPYSSDQFIMIITRLKPLRGRFL